MLSIGTPQKLKDKYFQCLGTRMHEPTAYCSQVLIPRLRLASSSTIHLNHGLDCHVHVTLFGVTASTSPTKLQNQTGRRPSVKTLIFLLIIFNRTSLSLAICTFSIRYQVLPMYTLAGRQRNTRR